MGIEGVVLVEPSRQNFVEGLLKLTRTGSDFRASIRAQVATLERYDTPSSRRLVAKLKSCDAKALVRKAESLNLSFLLPATNPRLINKEFDSLYCFPDRSGIADWFRVNRTSVLEVYAPERLDWLWDFSWTYILWGPKRVPLSYVDYYGRIRGPKPWSLHSLPFQPSLNFVRKTLLKERERAVYQAAKKGDVEALVLLGLSKTGAEQAVALTLELRTTHLLEHRAKQSG